MPASRKRVKQVWRSWWQVAWARPARASAPSMISSSPAASAAGLGAAPSERQRRGRWLRSGFARRRCSARGRRRSGPTGARSVVSALALGYEHPTLAGIDVAQSQAEHLPAAEAPEDHRFEHGPIPVPSRPPSGRPRHPGTAHGKCLGCADERSPGPAAAAARTTSGQPTRNGVRRDRDVAPNRQLGIEARPLDSRRATVRADRPLSPSSRRTTCVPQRGARWAVRNANTSAASPRPAPCRPLQRRSSGPRRSPARCWSGLWRPRKRGTHRGAGGRG